MALSGKSSLILWENKSAFHKEGHILFLLEEYIFVEHIKDR